MKMWEGLENSKTNTSCACQFTRSGISVDRGHRMPQGGIVVGQRRRWEGVEDTTPHEPEHELKF